MDKKTELVQLLTSVILVLISLPLLLLGSKQFGLTIAGIGLFFTGILLPLFKPISKGR